MIVKKVVIDKANRIFQMPPEILSFMREKMRPSPIKKTELIDLARFNWPVAMPPDGVPEAAMFAPASAKRIDSLKEALAQWLMDHRGAKVNSTREIFVGGGISSIMLSITLGFVDNGDIVFVPELGVPIYKKAVTACGGEPVHYGLNAKSEWRPDFERISTRLGRVARLLFLNTPHNPTGAVLSEKELEDLIWAAARENIVIVNDAAYQSISQRPPTSLLAIEGGRKVGVEVYSFAYSFGLPAFPFGFAVGNRDIIAGLEQVSGLVRPFVPDYYVEAALSAIRHYPSDGLTAVRERIAQVSAEVTKFLSQLSLEKCGYDTIPFVWTKIAGRRSARTQAGILYRRLRILVAPGTGFGETGEGFLRLSLTCRPEDYQAALERLKRRQNLLKLSETS